MPVSLTWNITGMKEVRATLQELSNTEWQRRAMYKSVMLIQGAMAKYPPARSFRQVTRRSSLFSRGATPVAGRTGRFWASSYRRTGTLGRSWNGQVSVSTSAVTGRVGTPVKYAPWVQSSQFQAWMHQGRWQTDAQVIRDNQGNVEAFFGAELRRFLKG